MSPLDPKCPVPAPQPWSVTALNLPEHAGNPIHTDAGARAAGFPGALVAGVTTYAYLTHPLLAAWGLDWLEHGGGEVRFRSPVFEHDVVTCDPVPDDEPGAQGAVIVSARCESGTEPERARAVFRAVPSAGPPPPMRDGECLEPMVVRLTDELGAEYGLRCGDELTLCTDHGLVHPAVWPAVANRLFHTQLVRGPWIHTRSIIRHHALVPDGAEAVVHSSVVERFARRGERAIVDVRIEVEGRPVATLEHEAIIRLDAD